MDASLNLEGKHPFCFRLDPAVIVIVNILGNRLGEGLKGGLILFKSIEHFIFQSTEEGFHNAVVVTVALSGHGLNDSVFLKFTTVECVLVLPALIRVHDQTLYRRKPFKRFIQHISYLLHIRAGRKIVRDNLICVHIQNRRNIALAPRQIELRYIGRPLLQRFLGIEISVNNVIGDFANIAFVRMVLFFGTFAKQCKLVYNRLVKIFLLYSHWCFWPFPLSIQSNALLFVLIAVFHKNTPNTGCPVLGVHIIISEE